MYERENINNENLPCNWNVFLNKDVSFSKIILQGKTNFNFGNVETVFTQCACFFSKTIGPQCQTVFLSSCTSKFSLALITFWTQAQAGINCQKGDPFNSPTWSFRLLPMSVCTAEERTNSWKYDMLLRQQIHLPKGNWLRLFAIRSLYSIWTTLDQV